MHHYLIHPLRKFNDFILPFSIFFRKLINFIFQTPRITFTSYIQHSSTPFRVFSRKESGILNFKMTQSFYILFESHKHIAWVSSRIKLSLCHVSHVLRVVSHTHWSCPLSCTMHESCTFSRVASSQVKCIQSSHTTSPICRVLSQPLELFIS